MDYTQRYRSPLGGITLASDGEELTGLWFDGQKYFARTLDENHEEKSLPVFGQAIQWLDQYFSGRNPGFVPPLRPQGTAFQKAVWDILLSIPYGQTVTYREISARMGYAHMCAQAVGSAVGRNPISIIIPCHRVISANRSLTGYAGGVERKARLLELEGVCARFPA